MGAGRGLVSGGVADVRDFSHVAATDGGATSLVAGGGKENVACLEEESEDRSAAGRRNLAIVIVQHRGQKKSEGERKANRARQAGAKAHRCEDCNGGLKKQPEDATIVQSEGREV